MAVDDVDTLRTVLADQCRPFVRALPAANDEDACSREHVELHEVTGASSPPCLAL